MDQGGATVDATTQAIANLAPNVDLGYDPATRQLSSSRGADVTLPLFNSSTAGLVGASGGGTANFLRADGAWTAPPGGAGTDLSYDPATRLLSSSTGADVTLTLADSTNPGLLTAAGFSKLQGVANNATNTPLASTPPAALGATAVGSSGAAARADHVHAIPTAADVGAVASGAIIASGLTMATNRLIGRSSAGTGAPEELALGGALSFSGNTLAFSDVIKFLVSNKGETATAAANYVETTVPRACTVMAATWELAPTAPGSSSSQAMLYARRSAVKTSLLSSNASLAANAILADATNLLTGSLVLSAGDTLGVDLAAVGTGSSGHIFTVLIRYY